MSKTLTRKRSENKKRSKKVDIPNLIDFKNIDGYDEYIRINNIQMLEKHTYTPSTVLIPNIQKKFNRLLIYKFKINDINVIYDFHPIIYDLLYQMYNFKTIESILTYFRKETKSGHGLMIKIKNKSRSDIIKFISKMNELYSSKTSYNIDQYISKKNTLYIKGDNKNVELFKPIIIEDNNINKNNNIKKNNENNENKNKEIHSVTMGEAFKNEEMDIGNLLTQPNKVNTPTQKV